MHSPEHTQSELSFTGCGLFCVDALLSFSNIIKVFVCNDNNVRTVCVGTERKYLEDENSLREDQKSELTLRESFFKRGFRAFFTSKQQDREELCKHAAESSRPRPHRVRWSQPQGASAA